MSRQIEDDDASSGQARFEIEYVEVTGLRRRGGVLRCGRPQRQELINR